MIYNIVDIEGHSDSYNAVSFEIRILQDGTVI